MTSVLELNETHSLTQKDASATKEPSQHREKFPRYVLAPSRTMKAHTGKLMGMLGTTSTLSYRSGRE